MIYLYDKNSKIFSNEGLGSLSDFVEEPKVTYSKSFCQIEFAYHLDGYNAELLVKENIIKSKISPDSDWVRFTIIERDEDIVDRIVYITAELTMFRELKSRVVKATRYNEISADMMIGTIMGSLDRSLDLRITGTSSFNHTVEIEDTNAYDAIFGKDGIVETTGIDVKFLEFGMVIGDNLGTVQADTIYETDFVEKMRVLENSEDMVTRIIPFTTLMNEYSYLEGDRYTKNTKEEKVYGDAIVSPIVNEKGYGIRTRFVEYRNERLDSSRIETFNIQRGERTDTQEIELYDYKYMDISQLNNEAKEFFNRNKGIEEPELKIDLDILGLIQNKYDIVDTLRLYDTVDIVLMRNNTSHEVQVTEVVYDVYLNRIVNLKFTTGKLNMHQALKNINAGKVSQQALSEQAFKQFIEQEIKNYLYNRQGQRLEFGSVLPDPAEYKEGDIYFLEKGDLTEVYFLVNGAWQPELGMFNDRYVKDQIEDIKSQTDQLKQDITTAREKADKAISDSGNAVDIAEGAKQLIDSTVKSTEDLKVQINEEVSNLNQLIADLDTIGGNLFSVEQAKQTKNADGTYTLIIPVESNSNYAIASTNSEVTVDGLKVPQVINSGDKTTITVVVPQSVIDGTDKVMVNKGTDYQEWRPNIYDNQMRINELYNRLMLNDSKLEEALREIKESANKIDNLESQSNVTMDVIGNDGMVSYSKNRLSVPDKEDKTTFTLPKYESVSIGHNGEGFVLGKTYTLSWAQLEENCVGLNTVNITLKE